ncbi:MAG: hypothetical protein ACPG4T_15195 [Nannocystaceae bacterium]
MTDRFTTFCGHLNELNGLDIESGVASSTLIAQVWHGPYLVADCTSHEWAERVARSLNDTDQHTARSGEGE